MNDRLRDEIIQKRGYDTFIQADELSLKISSYPVTAKYLAERLSANGDTLCELCCGIGVSMIEASRYFNTVIGVDNDTDTIEFARKNISMNGRDNFELMLGDVTDKTLLAAINADIVTYDIPYWTDHDGAVDQNNPDLKEVIDSVRSNITNKIVVHSPPHYSYENAAELFDEFEYQEVWIDDRHDRNFIYLGPLISHVGRTKVVLANG